MGCHLPPPKAVCGPGEDRGAPAQPVLVVPSRTHRGTRHYCSTVLVMHQCSTCTPAVLQPGISRYFIWGPQILVPKMPPCIIFQPDGSELSPRLGPVPWPDEPSEGTVLTQPSAPTAPQGPERAGRQPGALGCSVAVQGQRGCCQVGVLGGSALGPLPGCPHRRAKVPVLPSGRNICVFGGSRP